MRLNSYNKTSDTNIGLFSCRFEVSLFPFSLLLGDHLLRLLGRKSLKLSGRLFCWTALGVIRLLIAVTGIPTWLLVPVFLF